MGGDLAVAVRWPDGEVMCREVWTNPTPKWFKDVRWITGQRDYINQYFVAAEGKSYPLGPSEYGLVVWDFMENYLLDNNHYSDYTRLEAYQTFLDDKIRDNFRGLAEARRLRRLIYGSSNRYGDAFYRSENMHPDAAISSFHESVARSKMDSRAFTMLSGEIFEIDIAPLRLVEMGQQSPKLYRDFLVEIGFTLNDRAEALWEEAQRNHEGDYDDE